MPTLPIHFESKRSIEGYVVRSGRIKPKGSRKEALRPLDFHAHLYAQFAELDGKPESFRAFMEVFGPVTHDGDHTGESTKHLVNLWLNMRKAVTVAEDDPKKLLQLGAISPARREAIGDMWDDAIERVEGRRPRRTDRRQFPVIDLVATIDARLRPGPPDGRPTLSLAPDTLWDAMLLQLFQAIGGGARLKACEHCRGWFPAGGDSGKRVDARFCSSNCRVRHHLQKTNEAKS